jgi:hypothetical protein
VQRLACLRIRVLKDKRFASPDNLHIQIIVMINDNGDNKNILCKTVSNECQKPVRALWTR